MHSFQIDLYCSPSQSYSLVHNPTSSHLTQIVFRTPYACRTNFPPPPSTSTSPSPSPSSGSSSSSGLSETGIIILVTVLFVVVFIPAVLLAIYLFIRFFCTTNRNHADGDPQQLATENETEMASRPGGQYVAMPTAVTTFIAPPPDSFGDSSQEGSESVKAEPTATSASNPPAESLHDPVDGTQNNREPNDSTSPVHAINDGDSEFSV